MLGTTFHVTGDATDCTAQELYRAVMQVDAEMKASLSIFDEGSLLSRINHNETDSVDAHVARNLELAQEIGRLSGGYYDVTVAPLVEAWGFAAAEGVAEPDVDSLLEFVGYDRVFIHRGRLIKEDPRIRLDFNSIAKGYTVDRVAALMEEYGAANYLVEIGGECRARGVNERGNTWRVGIETPFEGNMSDGEFLTASVALAEGGLATSGNYRRFRFDEKGNKIAHTIDPFTGRSAVSRLLSVTVVAETAARADALATMYMSMGDRRAIAAMSGTVFFILDDGRGGYETLCSPEMERLMQ